MTDAREIIADELDKCICPADPWANAVINRLEAAGYRILGPDEVDPVTVGKAAKLVEEGREVRDPLDNYESTIMVDWEDMDKLAAAIRALGRKAGR